MKRLLLVGLLLSLTSCAAGVAYETPVQEMARWKRQRLENGLTIKRTDIYQKSKGMTAVLRVPKPTVVTAHVYDINGQNVACLYTGLVTKEITLRWDGVREDGYPPVGHYSLNVRADGQTAVRYFVWH